MASRSVRHRQHKRLARIHLHGTQWRSVEAARLRALWQAEAVHRPGSFQLFFSFSFSSTEV
jgi:hypothetical protein